MPQRRTSAFYDARYAALPRHQFDTRGGVIDAVRIGDPNAPVALCLHGWGRHSSSRDLVYFVDSLLARGYQVIAPDMPGFGSTPGERHCSRSETNLSPGGPVQIVQDILNAVTAKPTTLVAYSWGGGIALSTALAMPSRIDKLVLFHTSYTPQGKELATIRQPVLQLWVKPDQVHPYQLGEIIKAQLPNCQSVVLDKIDGPAGPRRITFDATLPPHAWEAIASKAILPVVEGWLDALPPADIR